jgi:hypothetical protein
MGRARVLFVIVAGAVLALPVSAQSTASFSGVVVSDPGNQPVRQAVVTIAGDGLARSRSVVTDDAGRFVFEGLPAGRFIVSAAKPAYVTNAMGARRPGRAGTPIAIAAGQQVTNAQVVLPRGAVITGTVRDRSGAPADDMAVAAVPVDALAPGVMLRPETVATDDRGVYRIYGLSPGEYIVYVGLRLFGSSEMSVRSPAELDAAFKQLAQGPGRGEAPVRTKAVAHAPTFYPGTARISEAARITVSAGEERGAVDITMAITPVAALEGTVVNPDGSPATGVSVSLDPDGPRFDFGGMLATAPAGGGRFNYRGVLPGSYWITARSGGGRAGGAGAPTTWARTRVDANGEDILGLTLTLRPASRVTGRVIFDGTASKPAASPQFFVQLRAFSESIATSVPNFSLPTVTAPVSADGTFTLAGAMPGRNLLSVAIPPGSGWTLRSAMSGDRDLADVGVEVGDADLSGLVVTMTDRTTELSGALQTGAGVSATDFSVVAIPADKSLWLPNSRRVKVVRAGTDGRFVIRDLPAGDYLIAAATDAEAETLRDPAFLAQVAAGAVKVTLADGDRKVQDLKIAR